MKNRFAVGLIVGLVCGAGVGVFAGGRLGVNQVVGNWANTEANRTTEVLALLVKLRANESTQALDGLETQLNRHVFGLMPTTREGATLDPAALAHVAQAARAARTYRQEHPRPPVTALDKDVEAFLTALH